jgi:hypothetical protein
MSFGSVISLLVLVETVALLATVRWLLVGVRAAAAPPVPEVRPVGSLVGAGVVPPRSAPVSARPVATA